MTEKETKELTVRAKAGDKAALEELYREYSGRVKRFIMKQGLSEQDADDVLSDSFVEVMKHIGELENEEYFSTWLHRIARRKAVEFKEKQTRHQRVIFDTDDGTNGSDAAVEAAFEAEYGDTVMLPTDYAENEELKAIIAEQINSLGKEQRETLFLFYYQNKSINEIAEMTGTNANNVKARLFNARKSLKKKLKALQNNGVTLCAVPISKLLAELDEGGKGAAAAAVSGGSAASAEAAEVTSSAGAKIAAVAVAAVIVIGVGFGVSKLGHFKGDRHSEDSSEAVTTVTTTTTTAAVTTVAVPEIVDESAEESVTVTTTTTTTTTTTEATTEPPEEPAGGTTEAVIAPPAAEPEEKEPTEHDRWVDSIDGSYFFNNDLTGESATLSFSEQYKNGLANAYADGCGYMLVLKTLGGCDWGIYELVETKDGGKSWVVREDGIPLHYPTNGFSLDNGSWLLVWWQNKGSMCYVKDAISVNGGAVSFVQSTSWLDGLPLTDGTVYNAERIVYNGIVIVSDLVYLGGMDFKLTLRDCIQNYLDGQGGYIDGIDPDTFEGEILFNGIVTLDPATLNIKYYKTLPLEDE